MWQRALSRYVDFAWCCVGSYNGCICEAPCYLCSFQLRKIWNVRKEESKLKCVWFWQWKLFCFPAGFVHVWDSMLYGSGCPQDKRAVNVQNKLCWTENTNLNSKSSLMLHFPAQTTGKSADSFYSSVGRWVGTLGPGEHIPLMLSLLDVQNLRVIQHQMPPCIFTLVATFFKRPKARIWSVTKANQPGGHDAAHWDLVCQGWPGRDSVLCLPAHCDAAAVRTAHLLKCFWLCRTTVCALNTHCLQYFFSDSGGALMTQFQRKLSNCCNYDKHLYANSTCFNLLGTTTHLYSIMDKEKTSLREKAQYSLRRNQMPAVTYAKLLCAEVINHLGWGIGVSVSFPARNPTVTIWPWGEKNPKPPYSILWSKELNFLLLHHITPVYVFYGTVKIRLVILYLQYSIVSLAYWITAR